eukprot:TRINITY_DN11829_c0_g1_i2.p1 TRINITY_DN11829_c0_g1~~TRINITY_DN11829_c0_g1_i2.p1  ORF type:complete len:261 (+),score=69.88 TRINITY_DN11829_c0_g1_i2:81-863(+)
MAPARVGSSPGDRGEEASNCVADIESADFVAVWLDEALSLEAPTPQRARKSAAAQPSQPTAVTDADGVAAVSDACGASAATTAAEAAEAHYRSCMRQLRCSLPLRMGICCARRVPDDNTWELRSHEVGLWPGCCLSMPQPLLARRLRQAKACAGAELAEGQRRRGSRWSDQLACSAQWVFTALRASNAPLVFRDGLSCIMRLHDLFVGDFWAEQWQQQWASAAAAVVGDAGALWEGLQADVWKHVLHLKAFFYSLAKVTT